jgi:hypothetical protein
MNDYTRGPSLLSQQDCPLLVVLHVEVCDAYCHTKPVVTHIHYLSCRPAGGQPLGAPALNLIKKPRPAPPARAGATKDATGAGASAAATAAPSAPAADEAPAGSGFGQALHAALSHLLPLVSYLPLSVATCNATSWAPRRDYDSNRLTRSPLQLAAGTVLVVDETVMGTGKLSEGGIASFQALYGVLQDQVGKGGGNPMQCPAGSGIHRD